MHCLVDMLNAVFLVVFFLCMAMSPGQRSPHHFSPEILASTYPGHGERSRSKFNLLEKKRLTYYPASIGMQIREPTAVPLLAVPLLAVPVFISVCDYRIHFFVLASVSGTF